MCAHGQAKLGFYPLPLAEADRLKNWLYFSEQFSALDPCVGDGIEFAHQLRDAPVRRYGIEIDAFRAEQASALGIDAAPEPSLRLGMWREQQPEMELVFLEHTD
jgi:hypothetical protein